MSDYLPEGLELMVTEKPYWKTKDMKEGDNKLRIVSRPITGWIDWDDKKPVRYRPECKPKQPFNPMKPVKPFWVCHVWDYAREALYVIEFTQNSILKALRSFGTDPDWGDFTQYDIKVKKEGSGLETQYSVTPLPHKPMTEKMKRAIETTPINLHALYEGGDPWMDLDLGLSTTEAPQKEALFKCFKDDMIPTDTLETFLEGMAEKKGQTLNEVCKTLLREENAALLAQVKRNYEKSLSA